MGSTQSVISHDFGRLDLGLCNLCLQCSTDRCPILSLMILWNKLDGDDGFLREENAILKKDLTHSIDHAQKMKEECRELRLNTHQMAQVKEEGKLMLQNSLQILQHDNGKLNNDLQNACKESDDLGGKISFIKEELL